jgi:hypothetical protein
MPSSLPVVTSFLPLLLKLFGGLAVIILGLLGRKKIYQMLGREQQTILTNVLATNQVKETQAETNVVELTQKKQDLEQQLTQVTNSVVQNPSQSQVLDFFAAEQTQINESSTK